MQLRRSIPINEPAIEDDTPMWEVWAITILPAILFILVGVFIGAIAATAPMKVDNSPVVIPHTYPVPDVIGCPA